MPETIRAHREEIDDVIAVDSDEAIEAMHALAWRTGVLVGPSVGRQLRGRATAASHAA